MRKNGYRIVVAGSLVLTAMVRNVWEFAAVYGVLVPLGLAGTGPVIASGVVARWFSKRRGTALSVLGSASMTGMSLLVPAVTWLILTTGWRTTYMLIANMLSRRIWEQYRDEVERAQGNASREPNRLVIVIEEAHKFIDRALSGQSIFGQIARELRKYNVTLLVIDQARGRSSMLAGQNCAKKLGSDG